MKPQLPPLLLAAISTLAFAVRLYKINSPLADWHSWRQADTAAVTRNFIKHGTSLLYPRFDDLSNIPSGQENPQGFRLVELPLYNLAHYSVFRIQQIIQPHCNSVNLSSIDCQMSIVFSGRLTTILASLLSLIFLYKIVQKLSSTLTALLSTLIFALLPYNIYYSRVILPDPLMVTTALGATWFFLKWLEAADKKSPEKSTTCESPLSTSKVAHHLKSPNKNSSSGGKCYASFPKVNIHKPHPSRLPAIGYLLLSSTLAASSLLLKPTAIFLLAPLSYLAFKKFKLPAFRQFPLYLYFLLALAPLVLWRLWIQQFPSGIPANQWLLNGDGIRLTPAWFRWLFYERLTKLILGGFGLALFILGALSKPQKSEGLFYLFSLLSLLLYLVILATGNVRHDYYQIPLIPIVSIFFAKGLVELWTNKNLNRWLSIPTSLFLIPASLFIGWYQIRDYYQINHPEIVRAGQAANRLLPPNARVIAPYQGDTAFLYQINRPGWPALTHPVEEMKRLGATHYVSINYDATTQELISKYPALEQTDQFIILNLTSPLK